MEQLQPYNHIQQVQDRISDGIVQRVKQDFQGGRLSLLLGDIVHDNEINIEPLHLETIRALGHYASVTAGELTNTAILFVPEPRSVWVEDGYSSQEIVVENEFIVVPRAQHTFKSSPTYERLTYADLAHRKSKERNNQANPEQPRQIQHVPSHISRLINRNGF